MIRVKGDGLTGTATECVSLHIQGESKIAGGRQQLVTLETPFDWCNYYGVRIEDDCAIVYKAVGDDYISQWGVCYEPGSIPVDEQWDGQKRECARGGGLNFSPTPRHTHQFVDDPKHYLECRIRLDEEFCVHFNGSYPEKVCHRTVAAPLVEVDVDGNPVGIQS